MPTSKAQTSQQIEPEPQLAKISKLAVTPTGQPELDEILEGGLPVGSVVLLSGSAGVGKTILSTQWLFEGFRQFKEPGIYISLTEPVTKTIRNLKTMSYFDESFLNPSAIHLTDLRSIMKGINLDKIEKFSYEHMEQIIKVIKALVQDTKAKRIVIDSVTAIGHRIQNTDLIRNFIFRLGTLLDQLDCTTILINENGHADQSIFGVEEFIADGIIMLRQEKLRFQKIRTLEVLKMRGIKYKSGSHSFRINEDGINLFPQLTVPLSYSSGTEKISIGVQGLDTMLKGGIYKGSSTLVAGSTGCGKSILGLHFIWEGLKKGDTCLLIGFEESRNQILRNALSFGFNFEEYEKKGVLKILCSYPNEKYMEEHLLRMKKTIESMNIKRCVVDSLSSLGSAFDEDQFRSFVKKMNAYLKAKNVTSLFTTATAALMNVETLTDAHISTMTDNIIVLKYVEMSGTVNTMAAVLKTRGDDHSKSLRQYRITNKGIVVGTSFKGYESVMSGSAVKVSSTIEEQLTEVFTRYLGPIGTVELSDLQKEGGLEKEKVLNFIDTLIKEGSLSSTNGDAMTGEVDKIYGNVFSFQTHELEVGKELKDKNNIVEKKGKSFISNIFNKL